MLWFDIEKKVFYSFVLVSKKNDYDFINWSLIQIVNSKCKSKAELHTYYTKDQNCFVYQIKNVHWI